MNELLIRDKIAATPFYSTETRLLFVVDFSFVCLFDLFFGCVLFLFLGVGVAGV